MKKGVFGLFFLIILLSFSVSAQTQNGGANICGIPRNCGGLSDGICPEDFFSQGVECYISDPDCCQIVNAGWSSSKTAFEPIDDNKAAEGQEVFMFVETKKCEGKDANFKVYVIDDRIFGDNLLDTEDEIRNPEAGPFRIDPASPGSKTSIKAVRWIAYTDPGAIKDGVSKFRFRVKINPEAFSNEFGNSDLEVSLEGTGGGVVNSCNDGIDNDADGCADEPEDCTADNNEGTPEPLKCPICSEIVFGGVNRCSACAGWKCNPGDCLEGRKSTNCPSLSEANSPFRGCPLVQPPKFVKCYERLVPFPFYDNFNLGLSILSLIGYYGLNLFRKKRLRKNKEDY